MPTTDLVEIDLRPVKALIAQALDTARSVDGLTPSEGNSASKAAAKRELLYLADTLDRAAAETRSVYHVLNGHPDPLAS